MTTTTAPPATASSPKSISNASDTGAGEQAQVSPRGLRKAHLWALTPIAISWFAISIGFIEPYDLWWNVKSGEIMSQCGRWDLSCFLGSDVLVWTSVRLPYSNPQWGSQLIFYWLYNLSPYLLLTVRTIIITSTVCALVWLCYQRSKSLRVSSIVAILAFITAWTNYGMRPQLLAFLPFIAFLVILENKDSHPRWLLLLTPIMLLWVNIHGSFFLGVALLGIYALGTVLEQIALRRTKGEGQKTNDEGPMTKGQDSVVGPSSLVRLSSFVIGPSSLKWQFVCFAAAALATLANPYVQGIYSYFFIATNDPIARAFNVEWQAPTIYDGTGILFYFNLFIFLASAYASKRRMRPTELLLVLAFGYLALTSIRNVIWWGWITAPIIASNFAAISANRAMRRALKSDPDAQSPSSRPVEVPALNWVLAVILVGSALTSTPLWRQANPLIPASESHALADNTPVKLADFIKSNRPPAPLFNYMEWGGYLEWELYPHYQLFIDGRFEARQIQVWKDYLAISRARADWQKIIDSYHVNTLILNKDFHADLIQSVKGAPTWRKLYEDKMGTVFVRD